MKLLITIWILLSLSIFAQSDCGNYETFLKKVEENYSELSPRPFPDYIKYTLSQKDTVNIKLFNVNGEIVYGENFGLLDGGKYIVKIFNPKCPGVYFVSSEIGNQPAYKKVILITSEASPLKGTEINTDTSASIIEGVWKRSYSEDFVPAIQPEPDLNKIEYHYKYDLQLQFSKGTYKIISERTDEDNEGKETKVFEGRFVVKGDTLKLYENSKLNKIFQYKIEEDTLSISFFVSKDEKLGRIVITMERNIYNSKLKIVGQYHK